MDRVIAWSTVAVLTIVVVLFFGLVQVTSCADAAPGQGESVCTTGPMGGAAVFWSVVIVGTAVVAASIWRIVRNVRIVRLVRTRHD